MSDLLIADIAGFTPHIGRLVSMLNNARQTTLAAVSGLSVSQLDHLHDAKSNSIGALLLHIAAAEYGYQLHTFWDRQLNAQDIQDWDGALALNESSREKINGHELPYYLGRLEQVRAVTLTELAKRDDSWLEQESTFGNGQRINNYYKWFHVLGHEINHRGQIRWLRSRA